MQLAYVNIGAGMIRPTTTMSHRVRVKLDLPVLISHLSREEGRDVPAAEVLQWLEDAGFSRDGDYWFVSEADLGQVDPTEVLEAEPLDDPGAS